MLNLGEVASTIICIVIPNLFRDNTQRRQFVMLKQVQHDELFFGSYLALHA